MFDDIEASLKKDKKKLSKHETHKMPDSMDLASKNFTEHNVKSSTNTDGANKKGTNTEEQGDVFNQRMKTLHKKGRRRGKRYSVIGISTSIIILIGAVTVGYYFLSEVNSISSEIEENDNIPLEASIDKDNICQMDYCCLASLKRILKNNFQRYDEEEGCTSGYEVKDLDCENSLKWCEPKEKKEKLIECTKKGGFINPPELKGQTEYFDECCEGLIGAVGYQAREDGGCDVISGTPYLTCIACGDGKCEELNPWFENICNCPTDCSLSSTSTEGLIIDSDDDQLNDKEEIQYGTNPNNPDTDGDGFLDGEEVKAGFNPLGEGTIPNNFIINQATGTDHMLIDEDEN